MRRKARKRVTKASVTLKTMTPKEAVAAIETGKTPRANWGANELPRCCPRCHGISNSVRNTRTVINRVIRYRKCDCGQVFVTNEKNIATP